MFILTDKFGNVDYVSRSKEAMKKHLNTYGYCLDFGLWVIETHYEKFYLSEFEFDFETNRNMIYVTSRVDGPAIKVYETMNEVRIDSFRYGMDENGKYLFDDAVPTTLDSTIEMGIRLTYTKIHAN